MFFRRSLKQILLMPDALAAFNQLYDRIDRRKNLNRIQQGVVDTWWLFAEVSNGSFDQYLGNSASDHFARMEAFMSAIGATQATEAMQAIRKIFPQSEVPLERRNRIAALHEWVAKLGEDDAERHIGRLSDSLLVARRDIATAVVEYVRNHEEEYNRE